MKKNGKQKRKAIRRKLRAIGLAHLAPLEPGPSFAECQCLAGVRDAVAMFGVEVVAQRNAFDLIGAGLRANYVGRTFKFDHATFENAIRAMSKRNRWWLVTRNGTTRRLATVRLSRIGKLLAAEVPITGKRMTAADLARCAAVLENERRQQSERRRKATEGQRRPPEVTADNVLRLFAKMMIDALKKAQKPNPPPEGTQGRTEASP